MVDGFFDSDKTDSEELADEAASERWKRFWRENPSVNPKMTEAYVNE